MEAHSTSSTNTPFSEIHIGTETTRKWSDLPKDILTRIVAYLDWKTDLTRIRGVCPDWRSALQLSEFPLKIAPSEPISPKLNLLHSRFYFLSPLTPSVDDRRGLGGNWVARFFELGSNQRHIFNPFNHQEYFFPEPPISGSLNLLDCRVLELACVYSLLADSWDDSEILTRKVVGGLNVNSGYRYVFLAELINGSGFLYWTLGEKNCPRIEISDSFRVLDIVYHQEKFYMFELSGWRIGVINPQSQSAMKFIPGPRIPGEAIRFRNCHFVSSNDKLYLIFMAIVESDHRDENKDNVFVFVMKDSAWEHVHSLEDAIFFIGDDVSFSLPRSSSNLPQWKPNSICFFSRKSSLTLDQSSKGSLDMKNLPEGAEVLDCITYPMYWRYFRLFELDQPEKGIVPFENLSKKTYTGLFFPPPPWVKWQCPSRGNADVRLDGLEFNGIFCEHSN